MALVIVLNMCILTACSNSDNTENTDSSETTNDTTVSQTKESTTEQTSEEIIITSESAATTQEPEPHEVSWLNPADPDLYNFTPEQRRVYSVMMEGIKNNINPIAMPCNITPDEVEKIYTFVKNNLYEYCNLTGKYRRPPNNKVIDSITVDYKYDAHEVQSMKTELSQKADKIMSYFFDGMSEWEKIKFLHDYIVLNCKYDLEATNSSSAYGALIDGRATCEGYSKAMAYLCNKAGIECMLVTGYGGGEEHMWNMVKYNGNWYHMDVTWDDPSTLVFGEEYVKYDYFNLTTSQIRLDHKIIPENNFFKYPEAVAIEGNYFIKKGAYINTYNEARKIFVKQIASGVDNNLKYISAKIATQTLYNDIVSNVKKTNGLFSWIREANEVSDKKFDVVYSQWGKNPKSYIISIYIKELSQN